MRRSIAMRLPELQMSKLLKCALRLNDARIVTGDPLTSTPEKVHELLQADRSFFWQVTGGALQLRNLVRRIERAAPPLRRKWSNDRCILCSYSTHLVCRGEAGRQILSIGRNHASNQIVCVIFSRNCDSNVFSIAEFTMSHLAIGFALDSIGSHAGVQAVAIEVEERRLKRLAGGGASLLSSRIDHFLSDRE